MKNKFVKLLRSELIPALGCTEPISIAYVASYARNLLKEFPEKVYVECSGSVIKNVKGVIVPGTKSLKGIEISAVLGVIIGEPYRNLEVLSNVNEKQIEQALKLIKEDICTVSVLKGYDGLAIRVSLQGKESNCSVLVENHHMNIVSQELNGKVLNERFQDNDDYLNLYQNYTFDFAEILDFIRNDNLFDLEELLLNQVKLNMEIAKIGLCNDFGLNIGRTIQDSFSKSVANKAISLTSAGSDARMGGSIMPVVINSGSGNQGLVTTIPVKVYAEELSVDESLLVKALALSNLVSIYIKKQIGKLSAFCGAVSAACGAAAGIALLHDETDEVIKNTVINTLANTTGIICDGAKASCAIKIATSIDSAILGFHLAKNGKRFEAGDGIVKETVDETIKAVAQVAKFGMTSTNDEIIKVMTSSK